MVPSATRRVSVKWTVIGVWQGKESLDSYRTGTPIYTYHHTQLEWWEPLSIADLTVLFGALVVGFGLGWIKSSSQRPM